MEMAGSAVNLAASGSGDHSQLIWHGFSNSLKLDRPVGNRLEPENAATAGNLRLGRLLRCKPTASPVSLAANPISGGVYRRGSTGSDSNASTANTYSCTRHSASPAGGPVERLDTECILAGRQRAFAAQSALAQSLKVPGFWVVRAVDDPQVFAAADFHARLPRTVIRRPQRPQMARPATARTLRGRGRRRGLRRARRRWPAAVSGWSRTGPS